MRWPIQLQLLMPMLVVVLLAIVLASGTTAYWAVARARAQQEDDLRRVARVLAQATYPLTEPVLEQLSGLSGADLVVFDSQGRLRATTLRVGPGELRRLTGRNQDKAGMAESLPREGLVVLGGTAYLCDRLPREHGSLSPAAESLFILYPKDRWSRQIRQAALPALVTGALAAVAAALTAVFLARRLVRPIHELVRCTAAISKGGFAPVTVSRRNDELRDLEAAINRMGERLAEYEAETRRAERLHTLGKIGAGLAHQLRNAAAGGRIAVELHQRDCPLRPTDESLPVALRQFGLMESFLQRFLALGGEGGHERARLPAAALIAEVLALVRPTSEHLGVPIEFRDPGEPIELVGDAAAVRELLTNLILNACEASKDAPRSGPRVVVTLGQPALGWGEIRVCDAGPGPPDSVRDRLFEPFATGKPDGLGLGLFVARQVAQAHGGDLTWERRDGMTCFAFRFPLHRE